MCGEKSVAVKNYLQKHIDELLSDKSRRDDFSSLVNYKNYLDERVDARVGLRQDDSKIMQFPNKSGADERQLRELNLLGIYDSQVFCSNLVIVANIINNEFENEIRRIFGIGKSGSNHDKGK